MSVNSYAESLSSDLVLSHSEKENIKRSITTLRTRLNFYFGDIKEMFEFGSYTRGTILPRKADSNSDIDFMVVFDNSDDYKPQTYLNRLKKFVEKYYSTSEIFQSSPTIVLNLNHIKFELVPAYSPISLWSATYYIPAPKQDYREWMETSPNNFNQSLIDKNNQENSKIKPVIRLAKYWNASQGRVYSSYALEEYIVKLSYGYFSTSVFDYFYDFALSLSTGHLNVTAKTKVDRLQSIVREIKQLKDNGSEYSAEQKLKKILPEL